LENPAADESGEPVTPAPGQIGEDPALRPVPLPVGPGVTVKLHLPGHEPAPGRLWGIPVQLGLVEGVAAVLAFLAFVFVGQISFLVSLGLAVGVYFGVMMLLPARKPDQLVIDAVTASELQRALAEGRARVARIQRETEGAARLPLSTIVRTAESILADFEERPRHVSEARFAFDTLLDATMMSLDRYEKFSRLSGPAAQRGRDVLEGRVFPTIERGLQQLLEKLLQDDLRALNVDAAVLEQLLDLEGLSKEGRKREAGSAGESEGSERRST
jgi:hypothetical protein